MKPRPRGGSGRVLDAVGSSCLPSRASVPTASSTGGAAGWTGGPSGSGTTSASTTSGLAKSGGGSEGGPTTALSWRGIAAMPSNTSCQGSLGLADNSISALVPRPPRSKASRIAASRTDSDSALVAMPNSSRSIRSAASSSRWRALALTCGALAPCQSHTVVPRRACRRHCSPFLLCAMHLRAGLPRW
jgi:hypothetical protein